MEHEEGNYDHLVFLGDAFHSHDSPPQVTGLRETARWYAGLIDRPATTVLLGNHDAPLMESWSQARQFRAKRPLLHGCSGFRNNHAIDAAKEIVWEQWRKAQLFAVVNGWLCSHAGVHPSFWRPLLSDEANLAALWRDAQEALDMLPFKVHPLLACGFARGGTDDHGGVTWLDWDCEFEDERGILPQLVGHTSRFDLHRRVGRSWCIDSGVGYVLLHEDGTIEHKTLKREGRVGEEKRWVPGVPQFRDDTEHALARRYCTNANLLGP